MTVKGTRNVARRAGYRLLMAGMSALLLFGLIVQGRGVTKAAALPNGFKSVGYMPSWAGSANSIQYTKITHINYAFLLANTDGSLRSLDNPSKLQSIVSQAHANNVKVQISVGGWSGDSVDDTFEALAANSTSRTNFINNMVNFVNQYSLDGVDIDWEYPKASSINNYTALMRGLGTEMHNRGKLLTAAVVSDGSAADGISSEVLGIVDWLNIMAYDGGEPHANYNWTISSINFWRNKGLPAAKLVVGIPFYARPGEIFNYAQAVAANPNNANQDCATVNGVYGCYNGIPTVKRKTQYAKDNGLGGVMYWEMSQDTTGSTSLVNAIYEVATGGTNPTVPPTTPPSNNLALNKPATASSVEASGYEAAKAVDGNPGTRWSSAFGDPQWLRVDLGAAYAVNRVILNWEAAYGSGYQIQLSNDGNAWTTIKTVSGGDGGSDDLTGLSGTGRYIRVYGTTRATAWGYSLWEFSVFGTPSNVTPTPITPTATATPVTPTPITPTKTPTPVTPTTIGGYPAWAPNTAYAIGAKVKYGSANYQCLQAHTSLTGWEPPNTPALWQPIP